LLGFPGHECVHKAIATSNPETKMHVIYRGKTYEVAHTDYFGLDSGLYGLKSRFPHGSTFPAKKSDCRPVKEASAHLTSKK
jgi:hypothetical protein